MALECMSSEFMNDAVYSSQHSMDLPIEIIVYIMEFLPLADRIRASQVCLSWYEASRHPKLHKNEIVVLHDDVTRPLKCLVSSYGTFLNFLFKEVELNSKLTALWDKYCPQIQYLGLFSCILSEKMLVDILSKCYHLESLVVHNCRELLMTGRVLEIESDVLSLRKTLINVKELSITHNRYMSDAIFFRFVSIVPNLQELDLSGCQISFHNGLYKKFYPSTLVDESNFMLSENVLTFTVIVKYIRNQAQKIKVLKFGHTLIDNSALSCLAQTPHLVLHTLHLQACDQLTNTGLVELVSIQKLLSYLDLSKCSRITDHALIAICHNLSNLRALNICNCRAITNIGVAELVKLEKLQYLNLAQCELVTGEGIVTGLCQKVNRNLKKLNVCALLLDEESVCHIARNLPNLQLLDLSWCFSAVTDRSLQTICKNLLHLQVLKLASCNKISDVGVTGAIMSERSTIPNLQTVDKEYPDPFHKINLRTRAEKEIVADAQRKYDVFSKCSDKVFGDKCLNKIRGLRHLDLSGCNRITDVGLVYAFHFVCLQHLDLSRCQQVTHTGLSALSVNNPSIEVLIMNDCFNINDQAILMVVEHLKRLKHLDVQGCNNLTNESLNAIGLFCTCLQYLNVNYCVRMSVNAALQIQKKVMSLHTLHYINLKNETVYESEIVSVPPSPPPPPSKNIFRCFLR